MFIVAMDCYDLKLYEDENVNRMHESMQLFDEICNSKWFMNTALVLFLNKSDLFKEKIEKVDLKVCFADYSGGCSFNNASVYLLSKFKSLNRTPAKQVYTHLTCATDTVRMLMRPSVCVYCTDKITALAQENVRFVFNSVRDVVLKGTLDESGF